jgi:hypothetical protein
MTRLLTCSFLAAFLLASPVHARPPYKKAFVDLLNLPNNSRLNDCRTCHLPSKAGAEESDRPHNAFGARLKEVRGELKKDGKPFDITARLLAIANEDSDGDGVANLLELLSDKLPGDKGDMPAAMSLERARTRQVELLASLQGYRWRPFDRVERPSVPTVKTTWGRNAIDRFIAAEQEKHDLTPRPEAPREGLLRRVYLDLTGLPPTPAQRRAFLNDTRAEAYEHLVEQLLQSPRYGERWGRHWMDVWRYSDWAGWGQQVRDSQPGIWHWRDWIIESLNVDRPYDRMVQEMLAADELAPTDTSALRATGFLVRNYKLLSREKWMQDTVDHTAMAFLGVTLGCARCHDHMYDAITQKEYYQVRAIFTPHQVRTDLVPRAYDANLNAPTFLFQRGDDRTPEKTPLAPGVPESLGGKYEVSTIAIPREVYDQTRLRPLIVRESKKYPPVANYPTTSSGRRLAFAKWLTARDNPLASRVAVNHIWLRHFGKGIVPAAFDFGKNGQPPSHPALLDWLAVEFMEQGWSMKELHRLILTSATYRQASTPSREALAKDPDNVYLWRFTPRRLEAEVVRDAMFAVANRLDTTMGGQDIPHALGLSLPRRSVYFQHAQEKQMEFLQIFDVASVTECYARKQAILPQQALALVNSDVVLQQARAIASEIEQESHGDAITFVRLAFERVLGRTPTGEEMATCVEFLRVPLSPLGRGVRGEASIRGRENLVHVLFNHHEFVTLR